MKKRPIDNHIAFEFFVPPSRDQLERIAGSIKHFNIEISPESHDEEVRKAFGRPYANPPLEKMIADAIDLGCKRIDLFFMIGLPKQTYQSVMGTVDYCRNLLERFQPYDKLIPFISPLAPFLDPGSTVFEEPEKFGYRLLYRTVEEHRQALTTPSWKYILNYETEWMDRHEIVASTYESGRRLDRLKAEFGLIDQTEQSVPQFWQEYVSEFWKNYESAKTNQTKNPYDFEIKQEKKPNIFSSVEHSLCIGCRSCEIIAPQVFHIDKISKMNPKSNVINQNGASLEKIIVPHKLAQQKQSKWKRRSQASAYTHTSEFLVFLLNRRIRNQ